MVAKFSAGQLNWHAIPWRELTVHQLSIKEGRNPRQYTDLHRHFTLEGEVEVEVCVMSSSSPPLSLKAGFFRFFPSPAL